MARECPTGRMQEGYRGIGGRGRGSVGWRPHYHVSMAMEIFWEGMGAQDGGFKAEGLLDSGCSRNVCGSQWLQKFVDALKQKGMRDRLEEREVNTTFLFGRDKRQSNKEVKLPVDLGQQIRHMWVDVIEEKPGDFELPLLISLPTMKKMRMVVNHETEQAWMGDTLLRTRMNTRGQMMMSLLQEETEEVLMARVGSVLEKHKGGRELELELNRVHKRLGHATRWRDF